jgi:8-oxo-dGTP diphosphatase
MVQPSNANHSNGLTEEQFLQSYDASQFERPSATVDMLIFTVMNKEQSNYRKLSAKKLQLLLVKRAEHPYLGQWALPGGFVAIDEAIDAAAHRVLKKEANIDGIYMEQLYTWGDVERDPRTRVISCSYMALADRTLLDVQAGDLEAEAAWFEVDFETLQTEQVRQDDRNETTQWIKLTLGREDDHLDAVLKVTRVTSGRNTQITREISQVSGIAFDHAKIIEYAIERLRNKIEYTSIAFQLMPPLFTLTELQQVYEVVLGKELLPAAFRRKMADMVVETDEFTKDAGHRPSRLFRFNADWIGR